MTHLRTVRLLLLAAAIPALVRLGRDLHPHYLVKRSLPAAAEAPYFRSEFLPDSPTRFSHAATLAELPTGDLVAAWYGGTDEISPDVVIYASTRDHATGKWSPARPVETRGGAHAALGSRVKSIGNPVLFSDEHGLRLFYVAVVGGGWSGGTICTKSSPDGINWSPAQHVVTSPFFDVGMLVRSAPVAYDDGTIALPLYHEMLSKWAGIARIDAEGDVVNLVRIEDERPLIQPWVIPTGADEASAFMRHSSRTPLVVTMATTRDAGLHWSPPVRTPLVQRDAAVAGTTLGDGSLLVFFNNTTSDRRDLSIARTPDRGAHWSLPYPLEHDLGEETQSLRREYSYPFVIRTRDGHTHLLYTWRRTEIRHVVFNDAWVASDPTLAVKR